MCVMDYDLVTNTLFMINYIFDYLLISPIVFFPISDPLKSKLSEIVTSEQVSGLVKLSEQTGNLQLSYNCAVIISKLEMTGA